jgi:hypothetical protein
MENKFRAVRYGLDGKLIDFGRQQELPVRELLEEYLALIDPAVDELGSRDAINGVRKIMERGTGADRQLKVFEESKGDLKAVVDYMAGAQSYSGSGSGEICLSSFRGLRGVARPVLEVVIAGQTVSVHERVEGCG